MNLDRTRHWIGRVTRWGALAAATALMASCGSGSIVSDLDAKRIIAVGDGFSDVGQAGHRFTVNDGTPNWLQQFAAYYGLTLEPSSQGGFGYAQGHARVAGPDTTSGTDAPSVAAQIDALLERTALDGTGDVIFINGGVSDVIAAVEEDGPGEAAEQRVREAASALAQQVHRLVDAGGRHVVITGLPNLGNTPWAHRLGVVEPVTEMSVTFNDQLLIGIHTLGDSVLFFDSALFYNLVYNDDRGGYPLDNRSDPVCTTPDVTTCTPQTVAVPDYNRYLFADEVYFTPEMQRAFVDEDYLENAYSRFRDRW